MAQMVLPSSLSSKCYNRQPDLATSTTASPMSGHRLWADILDEEDDSSIEWGEERMLPERMLSSSEPGTPSRHSQENGDHCAELVQSMCSAVLSKESSTLNAYAAEFLPTLSMSCPLVGVCDVIAEGDETKGCLEDAPCPEPLLVAFAPVRGLPAEGQKAIPLQSSSRRFWRKARDASLEVQPRVPQGIHREEIPEESLQRRIRNIQIGKETKEYQFHVEQMRLRRPGAEPLTPDPRDRTLSKRRWDREVQNWRQELRKHYLLETTGISFERVPEVASVASTEAEEAQSSEADDTTTVNSDDTSSQHW